jgi:hypothetical protein
VRLQIKTATLQLTKEENMSEIERLSSKVGNSWAALTLAVMIATAVLGIQFQLSSNQIGSVMIVTVIILCISSSIVQRSIDLMVAMIKVDAGPEPAEQKERPLLNEQPWRGK